MDKQEQKEYFHKQQEYVDENIKSIMKIYGGRYVIVYDNRIVDSAPDEFELARRHSLRHKFDFTLPALITKIQSSLEEHLKENEIRKQGYILDSPEAFI